MPNLLDATMAAARRGFCQMLDRASSGERLINAMTPAAPPGVPSPINFLRRRFCDSPYIPPTPPWSGGLCPGVSYRVVVNRKSTTRAVGDTGPGTNFDQDFGVNATGSVQGVRDKASYPSRASDVYVSTSSGDVFVDTGFVGQGVEIIRAQVSIKSVERRDGRPDTCTNPDRYNPPLLPGDNIHIENITYNDNSGNTFNTPIALTFGFMNINVNGEFNIPIRAEFNLQPNFNFDFNFNLNRDAPEPYYPPANPSEPVPVLPPGGDRSDDGAGGAPPDPENPDPPTPPNPGTQPRTQQLIKAVRVTVTDKIGDAGFYFQDENPDIAIPNFGNVNFKIQIGQQVFWTADIPVKNQRTLIPCPWSDYAIDVKGTPRKGIGWTLDPVYERVVIRPTFPVIT